VTGVTLLAAESLTAGYGRMDILHDVSLTVDVNEIVSIIGPNGAGKSTAFKTIVGLLRPRAGRVLFNGEEITGLRPDLVLRRGLAYVPQGRIVFPQMTVLENLEMGAYIERDPARVAAALEQVYALFPILAERRKQNAGTMSGGEQQMVAIARALMTTPRLILLDEPSLGLSPRFVTLIFEKLIALRQAGYTLMLVEQNATRALAVADRAYVLELGRNRFEAPARGCSPTPRSSASTSAAEPAWRPGAAGAIVSAYELSPGSGGGIPRWPPRPGAPPRVPRRARLLPAVARTRHVPEARLALHGRAARDRRGGVGSSSRGADGQVRGRGGRSNRAPGWRGAVGHRVADRPARPAEPRPRRGDDPRTAARLASPRVDHRASQAGR